MHRSPAEGTFERSENPKGAQAGAHFCFLTSARMNPLFHNIFKDFFISTLF